MLRKLSIVMVVVFLVASGNTTQVSSTGNLQFPKQEMNGFDYSSAGGCRLFLPWALLLFPWFCKCGKIHIGECEEEWDKGWTRLRSFTQHRDRWQLADWKGLKPVNASRCMETQPSCTSLCCIP